MTLLLYVLSNKVFIFYLCFLYRTYKKKGSIKAEPVCHLKLNHLHHNHEDDGEEGQHHLQFLVFVQVLDLLFEQENQFLGEQIF
jgi:hypothetical protein